MNAPTATQGPAAPRPPTPGPDAIPKLLSETDVYVKYGLHDKALEHLKKVLAIDPELPEAHERAREIHVAAGRRDEAARAGAQAIRSLLGRAQADRAREALARLREIAPKDPEVRELAQLIAGTEEVDLGAGEEEVVTPEEVPAAAALDEDALALSAAEHGEEEVVEDDSAVAPEPTLQGEDIALAAAQESAELPEAIVDDDVAVEAPPPAAPAFIAPPPAAPAFIAPPPVAPPFIAPPPAPPRAAPAPTPPPSHPPVPVVVAPPPPAPFVTAPPPPPAPVAVAPPPVSPRATPAPTPPPPPPAPADDEEIDLSDEIEEAEFFLEQGLLDEAREALQNLLAFYPGHSVVQAKLADVERRGKAAAPAPKAPAAGVGAVPESSGDASFDIARELADELGPAVGAGGGDEEFQYSVEDVFNQFKKGVEQTVKKEDSATHYDLGIAYKEMGLLEDAIHEFETALSGNDRKKEVDCLSMIGLCRMQNGQAADAVQAFRRALASDHLHRDAANAIHYDLATAYEAAGDAEAALYYFQRVAKASPAFRDAATRAQALGGGPGRPPAEDARSAARSAAASRPAAPRPGVDGARPTPARPAAPQAGGAPKKNIGYL